MNTSNEDTHLADERKEFEALQSIIGVLQPLSSEARARIFSSAGTFLSIGPTKPVVVPATNTPTGLSDTTGGHNIGFSEDRTMSPKEFLFEKQPHTDVERIACLAYYLTHYREMPFFKTLDLSKLNTEAAQPKFANAANATNNAVKRRYLVPATQGQRQLSAAGEQFIQVLPDRDAAREAMANASPKRAKRRSKTPAGKSNRETK